MLTKNGGEKMKNYYELDFTNFGYREKKLAFDVLEAYFKNPYAVEGDDLKIGFNTQSGYVFATDEEYNVYMINRKNELELYLTCDDCNAEDYLSELLKSDELDSAFWEGVCLECQIEQAKEQAEI